MNLLRMTLILVCCALPAVKICAANELTNGGFELPDFLPGTGLTIGPGTEPAEFQWTISFGTVDLANFPVEPFVRYPAFEGTQAVDLNGNTRGGMFQNFATIPGQEYLVSFAYADNPFESGTSTADVIVTDVGTGATLLSESVSHSTSMNDPAGADWFPFNDRFVAIDTVTRIAFVSTSASNSASGGIILDAVEIQLLTLVVPASYLVTRGAYVSGGVVELAESDNADLSLQRATSDLQSRTEFEVKAVSPVASPSSLEVTLEGSVFARSTVNQTIELFDYVAGSWQQVDTRAATRFTDSTTTVAATGDLSRFVEPGTMCIEARIRYQSPAVRQQFSSNTDQFIWTIGQ